MKEGIGDVCKDEFPRFACWPFFGSLMLGCRCFEGCLFMESRQGGAVTASFALSIYQWDESFVMIVPSPLLQRENQYDFFALSRSYSARSAIAIAMVDSG